jgi:hypothetical protein
MKTLQNSAKRLSSPPSCLCLLSIFFVLAFAGCQHHGHTSDPNLRRIDEMLDSQLPTGTPKSRVTFYLSSQGFPLQNATDPRDVVAIVHHVDTDTLQPATARVTFHFDAGNNLKTYELVPAPATSSQP